MNGSFVHRNDEPSSLTNWAVVFTSKSVMSMRWDAVMTAFFTSVTFGCITSQMFTAWHANTILNWLIFLNIYIGRLTERALFKAYFPITSGLLMVSRLAERILCIIFDSSGLTWPKLVNIWMRFRALVRTSPTNAVHSFNITDGSFDLTTTIKRWFTDGRVQL